MWYLHRFCIVFVVDADIIICNYIKPFFYAMGSKSDYYNMVVNPLFFSCNYLRSNLSPNYFLVVKTILSKPMAVTLFFFVSYLNSLPYRYFPVLSRGTHTLLGFNPISITAYNFFPVPFPHHLTTISVPNILISFRVPMALSRVRKPRW